MSELWQDESFLQSLPQQAHQSFKIYPSKKKPSKGKQRARFVYIEDPSGGETSTLAGA